MALITTLVLCARSQHLVMSVSVRRVHVVLSTLLDLRAEESRIVRHVKPPRCAEASRRPRALSQVRTQAIGALAQGPYPLIYQSALKSFSWLGALRNKRLINLNDGLLLFALTSIHIHFSSFQSKCLGFKFTDIFGIYTIMKNYWNPFQYLQKWRNKVSTYIYVLTDVQKYSNFSTGIAIRTSTRKVA